MKRQAVLCSLLLLLSSLLFAQPPAIEIPQPHGPTAAATAFLDLLVKGDFQTAAQNFTEAMKAAAPPPRLAQIWAPCRLSWDPTSAGSPRAR
jgi:hypothetical protein